MTKLSDMQLVLLSTAAGRDGGNLLPPAPSLGTRGDRIRRSVAALIGKALAVEVVTGEQPHSWREQDGILYGVAITAAGRIAIAADAPPEVSAGVADEVAVPAITLPPRPEAAPTTDPVPEDPRADSKIARVVGLLRRADGATLPELVDATGWLPHTTRAALTGLRKKGHAIDKGLREGATAYSIKAVA